MRADGLSRDVANARLLPGPGADVDIVEPRALTGFDAPVRRYLEFMRVPGSARVWSFRARWTGGFRRSPAAAFWPCEAAQYNTCIDVARVFRLRIRVAPLVSMTAHDTYVRGRGRMRATLIGLPVVDASGPELDTGELVTFLNDAILLAPSMLLSAGTTWSAVDDRSFDVTLTDRGRTVRARVLLDERGAPVDFVTTDRFLQPPGDKRWTRAEWHTPIDGWTLAGGHRLPTRGRGVWYLPSGPFAYCELAIVPSSFVINLQPDRNDGRIP